MNTEMNRRAALLAMLMLPGGVHAAGRGAASGQDAGPWTPLFNGRDLAGWETFLGLPHRLVEVPGQPKNAQGDYLNPIGVDNDPAGVFSVVRAEGQPAIRISGQIYGALTTRAAYDNYHLRFEFKWGEKRWPPRTEAVRDSGCCYHAVGPHGASYGFWMQSCEFQIQEGDCGDFYSLAGVIVDAEADPVKAGDPKTELTYRKGAAKVVGHTRRIVKDPGNEKPHGQWNTLDLYCLGQTSVHVVNGTPNMVLSGLRRRVDGREVPLDRGRIQLQSEAAEVFYRNLAIRSIREIPSL
jgi:hypothetical protein